MPKSKFTPYEAARAHSATSPRSGSIYLDYAAATPLDPKVERVVLKYLKLLGNPSSQHCFGRTAKAVLEQAHAKVGAVLHCRPEELVFTGSGTEADNLAILGVAVPVPRLPRRDCVPSGTGPCLPKTSTTSGAGRSALGRHLITTQIEHQAVLRACERLEQLGWQVTYLAPDTNGLISPEQVAAALRPNTALVSIGYANNEIGTIQPIAKIAKAIKSFKIENLKLKIYGKVPLFHTDASAAAGYLNLNVQKLGVDLLTINAAKIYGPQGIGCLFVRRGVQLMPMILGGDQELGRRAGSESPALVAGLAEALVIAEEKRAKESVRQTKLRDWLITETSRLNLEVRLNGDPVERLPNNINISFKDIEGERLVLDLDKQGIAVSTGSACTEHETGQSHVLKAIKAPAGWGNLRITLGRATTKDDLSFVIKILTAKVNSVR